MQIMILKTFTSKAHGLLRGGIGPITVDEQYGKALVRNGLAKVHVPRDMEQAPSIAAVPRAPHIPEDRPEHPSDDPRQRGRASGSESNSSARRQAGGAGRQSSSQPAGRASRARTSSTAKDERG